MGFSLPDWPCVNGTTEGIFHGSVLRVRRPYEAKSGESLSLSECRQIEARPSLVTFWTEHFYVRTS